MFWNSKALVIFWLNEQLKFAPTSADGYYRYWIGDRFCTTGLLIPGYHTRTLKHLTNVLTSALFSALPVAFTINFYVKLSFPLLKRKTKVGRNLNLVMAFGSSCVIYVNSQFWNLVYFSYMYYVNHFVIPHEFYKHPLHTNIGARQLQQFIVASTSIFNPFLQLIILQSYRKPMMSLLKKLKNFVS